MKQCLLQLISGILRFTHSISPEIINIGSTYLLYHSFLLLCIYMKYRISYLVSWDRSETKNLNLLKRILNIKLDHCFWNFKILGWNLNLN